MPGHPISESLADRRHLVVMLRLVTGARGRLLYGAVVDVSAGPEHRFSGWGGLREALRAWLADQTDPASASLSGLGNGSGAPLEAQRKSGRTNTD